MKEQDLCCGTTCDKVKVVAYINRLERENKVLKQTVEELKTKIREDVKDTRQFNKDMDNMYGMGTKTWNI